MTKTPKLDHVVKLALVRAADAVRYVPPLDDRWNDYMPKFYTDRL